MAEGAHLTSTISNEDDLPSIFEVLAQENLVLVLRPTLQHLLRVLAERNPSRYGRLFAHSDEVYLVMQLVLESYYLKHHSSSFSENFYGMKRCVLQNPLSALSSSESKGNGDTPLCGLPQSQHYRSLIFLVLVPYLKNKCDTYFEQLSSSAQVPDHHRQNMTYLKMKRFLCKAFLGAYPILHVAWETTMLAYQLAYIFGKSRFHTPFLKWAGVLLKNISDEDLLAKNASKPFSLHNKSWSESLSLIGNQALNSVAVTLSTTLSVGVFFLQFLEWWYASDQKTVSVTSLPNPSAPEPLLHDAAPALHTLCPLCQRVRTNDTALAVSGFVFCYSCISQYVLDNGCCPVTKYPATSDHLIRLYLPDS